MVEDRDKKEEDDHRDAEPQRVLYDCGQERVPDLRILHFNDVYHPGPAEEEPKGGAARLKSLADYYRKDDSFKDAPYPLTLFSGDAFNPSRESTVTKGDHMIPILNNIGIDAACVGNHEFDFGAAHFTFLAKQCEFPWLLANIFDPEHGRREPMGQCQRTQIMETSTGLKVGLIGLVEEEWTLKINNSLPSDLEFHDMKEIAKELAPRLREDGADIIVILSHARQERDYDFCENLPEGLVDIVLGGHDHWAEHKRFPNGVHFVRSGFDFKNLSYITGFKKDDGNSWDFTVVRNNLVSNIKEDNHMRQLQKESVETVQKQLDKDLGCTAVPLDARKDMCQLQETNFGNFLADLMRYNEQADCALINGGTFMGDKIFPSGRLIMRAIVDCFPFEDPIVVLQVTGQAIKEALENGVSKYPEADSCFPHVSNIHFTFDPDAKVGNRVHDVKIGGQELDMKKEYTMATRSHLGTGKCGYESLRGESDGGTAKEVVDDENGILVSTLLRKHFSAMSMVQTFQYITDKHHNHWDDVVKKVKSHGSSPEELSRERYGQVLAGRAFLKWKRKAGLGVDLEKQMREGTGELFPHWATGIAPMVEGRVRCVKPQRATAQRATLAAADGRNNEDPKRWESKAVLQKAKEIVTNGMAKVSLA